MKLTEEEARELADLENEEKARLAEEAEAEKRQHLDALRLSKKLAAKNGRPGHDFKVLETKVGNIAVRRPKDVEIDSFGENEDRSRGDIEKFAAAVTLEPPQLELLALFAENPGLAPAILGVVIDLAKVTREESAKK